MNRRLFVISLILVYLMSIPALASGRILIYDGFEHNYTNANVSVVIDGHNIRTPEITPMIIEGRTMVPVREIFESSQIKATVHWVDETRTVVITKDNLQVELSIGEKIAWVNEEEIQLDVPAMLIQDKAIGIYKAMVPIRFVAEVMGYQVQWYEETKTVGLFSPGVETDESLTTFSNIESVVSSKEVHRLPTALANEEVLLEVATVSEGEEIEEYEDEFTDHRTTLKSITGNEDGSSFFIKSEEGMSGIKYFIWDNKLVMDIKGVYMTHIDELYPFESEYIFRVRTSQYDVIDLTGRVVFDLKEGAMPKDIVIDEERQQIDIIFKEAGISDVTIHQDEHGDFIKLEGDYSEASVLRMKYPWRLIVDMEQSTRIDDEVSLDQIQGQFVTGIQFLQFDDETTRMIIDMKDMCDYRIEYNEDEGVTYFRFSETDMGDVLYSIEDYPTITIEKSEATTYEVEYDYHQKLTNIKLTNLPNEFSMPEFFSIGDNYYESVSYEGDKTIGTLKVKGKYIYEMFVVEKEEVLEFYCRRPRELYDHIVVIDPGHGGDQPGTGWNGITEKDVNLKIFNYFKPYAEANTTIKYYYTREEDETLYLKPRTKMANDLEADLYVSMHNNAMDIIKYPWKEEVRGLEVITSEEQDNSASEVLLGELIFKNFKALLPELELRAIKDNNKLYVIRNTDMPSIIIEYAYVSNKADAEKLKNESILQEAARITELTIHEYIHQYNSY